MSDVTFLVPGKSPSSTMEKTEQFQSMSGKASSKQKNVCLKLRMCVFLLFASALILCGWYEEYLIENDGEYDFNKYLREKYGYRHERTETPLMVALVDRHDANHAIALAAMVNRRLLVTFVCTGSGTRGYLLFHGVDCYELQETDVPRVAYEGSQSMQRVQTRLRLALEALHDNFQVLSIELSHDIYDTDFYGIFFCPYMNCHLVIQKHSQAFFLRPHLIAFKLLYEIMERLKENYYSDFWQVCKEVTADHVRNYKVNATVRDASVQSNDIYV